MSYEVFKAAFGQPARARAVDWDEEVLGGMLWTIIRNYGPNQLGL